jgi:two-component system, OmpR family, sensor histidine kinase BaeS
VNRIWVRLWLGIMTAFAGIVLSFEVAKLLAGAVFRVIPVRDTETAVAVWGSVGGSVLSVLLAALIAWYLARPLSAVSKAARQVAKGNLSARARLPTAKRGRLVSQWSGEAAILLHDFNVMAGSLEKLETERQATTAAIAHELRTPLAVLQARLAALRDGVFNLDLHEIHLLAQQTELLARLVEDLRSLSLADVGKLTLDLQTCDFAALVNEVVASFEPRASAKRVKLEVHTENVILVGDATRLRQVVANLLDNALRFTPEAGSILVTLQTGQGGVTLLVQDSGSGIAEGSQARIFERFYHTAASGSGLGLAIVKSFVELHGGQVEAANVPEGGAVFRVSLPGRYSVGKA